MKGDATFPYILACIIYDTKPVHIISTASDNFKWTPIKKKLYSKIYNNTVDMTFHYLGVIHMYNFGMGSVNVADQRCMQYIPYHWMCNRKCWWSIFIWLIGGTAKNAYLIYREIIFQSKINKMYRVPNGMSHLQFPVSMFTHHMAFKKRKLQ